MAGRCCSDTSVRACLLFFTWAKLIALGGFTAYMTQLAAVWGLCGAVLLIALPQVYFRVQNQTQEEVRLDTLRRDLDITSDRLSQAVDEAGDLAVQKERE